MTEEEGIIIIIIMITNTVVRLFPNSHPYFLAAPPEGFLFVCFVQH